MGRTSARHARPGDPLQRVDLLGLAPRRTARWREEERRVVLERPRPSTAGLRGWLERISYRLAPPRIRLDAIGSFAWSRLDGHATVGRVAEALREEFGEAAEPVEERVGEFVRMLRREGFLAYPGWDAPAAAPDGPAPPPDPEP